MSLRLQSVFQDFADIGIAKSDLTADEIEGDEEDVLGDDLPDYLK